MTLNYECVRDLILWIEKYQTISHTGKPDPIYMRRIYSEFEHSKADLNTAAQYLVDKKLVKLSVNPVPPSLAPTQFVFTGIAGTGYDYIAAVKDDTIWEKIKKALGSVALASVPSVIETATKFL